MQVKELGHIVLYLGDLARSRRFYGEVLGWREVAGMGRQAAVFSSGRTHHELLLLEVGPDATPIPAGNEVELYIDVQPERWREDPAAVVAPVRPLRI